MARPSRIPRAGRARTGAWTSPIGLALLGAVALAVSGDPPKTSPSKPQSATETSAERAASAPRPDRTATVGGTVRTASGRRLPPMIVYLQSTDPKRTFPTPAESVVVSQKNAQFSPAFVVVPVGQTVRFPNDEDRLIEHNVFSRSRAKPFDLGLYRPKESRSITFDRPGPVRLYCSIHRYMDGMIYVSPTPYFAHVAADGTYSIAGVEPGEYVVRTWQRSRRYPEQSGRVVVGKGESLVVDWELMRKASKR